MGIYLNSTARHFVLADQARRSAERAMTLNDPLDSSNLLQSINVLSVVPVFNRERYDSEGRGSAREQKTRRRDELVRLHVRVRE